MSLAAIFPGQGSQSPGMASELKARWPLAAKRFAEASEILGYDLFKLVSKGSEEELADTKLAQPALYVTGLATFEILAEQGFFPQFMAGHSLGEYTACAAAGVFSFAEGLRAVKARGEAMSAAAQKQPGAMLAVMGKSAGDLKGMLAKAASGGPVVVANYNSPEQSVVSGASAAIEALEPLLREAGLKVVRLKVSGAFHSPLMREAAEAMREVLAGIQFRDPSCPIIGNVAGMPLQSGRMLRDELHSQLISSVRWDACVRTLAGSGVLRVVECGPGKVLAGLIRRNDKSLKTFTTGSAKEIEETLKEVGGGASGKAE